MATKTPQASEEAVDDILAVTLRDANGYEYNLDLARSIIDDMLNPETPARFIEVPCLNQSGRDIPGSTRYLNTAYIKAIDVRGYK